jgi:hypothetical protein
MKKLTLSIFTFLALALNLLVAPVASAHPYDPDRFWDYAQSSDYGYAWDWNANDWLAYDYRAEIERSGQQPTWHYDFSTHQTWACDWVYRTEPGGWFCDKIYRFPPVYTGALYYPLQCAYGFHLSADSSYCYRIVPPANAHLNAKGDGWDCNSGYRKDGSATACVADLPPPPVFNGDFEDFISRYYVYCMTYYSQNPQLNCEWVKNYGKK